MKPIYNKINKIIQKKESQNCNQVLGISQKISSTRLSTSEFTPFQFHTPCKQTPKAVVVSPLFKSELQSYKNKKKKFQRCSSQKQMSREQKRRFSEHFQLVRVKPKQENQRLVLLPKTRLLKVDKKTNSRDAAQKRTRSASTNQVKKNNRINSSEILGNHPKIFLNTKPPNKTENKFFKVNQIKKKKERSFSVKNYQDEKFKFTQLLFDENIELNKKKFKLDSFLNKFSDKNFIEVLFQAQKL